MTEHSKRVESWGLSRNWLTMLRFRRYHKREVTEFMAKLSELIDAPNTNHKDLYRDIGHFDFMMLLYAHKTCFDENHQVLDHKDKQNLMRQCIQCHRLILNITAKAVSYEK